jgi:hypothetical protein
MHHRRSSVHGRLLLPASRRSRHDEHAHVLAVQRVARSERACGIPGGGEMGRLVAVARQNAEQEAVSG